MNHQHMIKPMLIGVAVLVALAIAGLPVGNFAPYLILLACPLMMVFMMRGMSHGGGQGEKHDHHSHAAPTRPDEP